jgi:hypothetical protein
MPPPSEPPRRRGHVGERHHLEPVAVVEVSTDDGAGRIQPGARQHDQTRTHAGLVFENDPDLVDSLGGVLGGAGHGAERGERHHGRGRDHAGEQSVHRVVGLK